MERRNCYTVVHNGQETKKKEMLEQKKWGKLYFPTWQIHFHIVFEGTVKNHCLGESQRKSQEVNHFDVDVVFMCFNTVLWKCRWLGIIFVLYEYLISVYLPKTKIYISNIADIPEDLHVHGFLIFLIWGGRTIILP